MCEEQRKREKVIILLKKLGLITHKNKTGKYLLNMMKYTSTLVFKKEKPINLEKLWKIIAPDQQIYQTSLNQKRFLRCSVLEGEKMRMNETCESFLFQ